MELNVDVWGEPIKENQGDMYYLASFNNTPASIRDLISNGKLAPNDYIDQSIFWCVAPNNNPLSRYSIAVESNRFGSYHKIVNGKVCNFMFTHTIQSTGGNPANIGYNNGYFGGYAYNRIGMGGATGLSHAYPITKIARGRICYLASVYYVTGVTATDLGYNFSGSIQVKPLSAFLTDSSLYMNNSVMVLGIIFEPYGVNTTNRSILSQVYISAIYETNTLKSDIPYNDYDLSLMDFYNGWNRQQDIITNAMYGDSTQIPEYQGSFVLGGYSSPLNADFNNDFIAKCAHVPSGWKYYNYVYGNGTRYIVWGLLGSDMSILEKSMHAFAYTGLFYSPNLTTAQTANLENPTDPNLYWGAVISGFATGKVCQGGVDDIAVTNSSLHSSTINDDYSNDFEGNENTDTNIYSDETPIAPPTLSPVGVFNRSYAMTKGNISALVDELWNADEDRFNEILAGQKLMGENPMNSLIDLRLYPFNVVQKLGGGSGQRIVIGRAQLDEYGVILNGTNAIIDLGECTFFRNFKNFLDYTPYTTGRLYLPYCGFVEIDTTEFMGHTIKAQLIVDVVTGACTCIVWRDNIIIINASGTIGVSIPMTGTDSAQYASSILGGLSGVVGSGASAAIGAATGNVAGAVSGVLDMLDNAYETAVTPTIFSKGGSASPHCSNWLPQYPYFIIDRPVTNIPDNYGHFIGYACEESKTLNSYNGLVVVSNPDLSGINATSNEKNIINSLLTGGVYI